MTNTQDNSLSLGQAIQSIWSHKLLACLSFAGVMILVGLLYMWLPREYDSEGRLFVQLGRGNVGLDPNPDPARSVSIQDSRETEIRSVVELLRSRGLLEEVVQQVTPERILANDITLPFEFGALFGSSDGKWGELPEDYDVLKKREQAVRKLAEDLKINSEKKTSVIEITCSAADPLLAQEIVNALMEGVQKLHVDVHRVEQSKTFFDKEFERQESELVEAEQALKQFRNENRFLSVDQARGTHHSVIDKLENQIVDIEIDLKQSEQRIASLQQRMAVIPEKMEMPVSGLQSLSTEGAHQLLNTRIAERAKLLSSYHENHPKVQSIDQEIEALRADVKALPTRRTEVTMESNRVFESIKIDLVKEQSRADALQARLEKVQSSYATAMDRLQILNGLKVEEEQLLRTIDTAKRYLATFTKKRGEAYINDQLDRNSVSDVVIAQKGSLILKKSSPRGSIILPIGAVFASCVALAACLWVDRKSHLNLTSNDEIEEVLDIPVLVTIPRVHTSRLLMN